MRRYLKVRNGFTFLEVMAALVILSIALIPIMNWVPLSLQTKLKTERKTIAIFLAQSKMEELRYQIVNDFNQTHSTPSPQPFPHPYENFYYTITEEPVNADFKTISVRVWHIEKPDDQTVFYTQIARR